MSEVHTEHGGPGPLDVSTSRVRLLLDRAVDLAGEHDLDVVLQRIVESAAAVAGAKYAALGVCGDVGTIAANIITRTPSQLIMLCTGAVREVWSQCVISPSENATPPCASS